MSRVIKFRAWDTENKTWAHVTLGDLVCGACTANGDKPLSGAEQIWEQYTEGTDKNGKEIYEGDIVKITRDLTKTRSAVYIYQIRYDVSRAAFTCWRNNHFACMFFAPCEEVEYEVIGNIHENPELLGDENE